MQRLHGRLLYTGLFNIPWGLVVDNDLVDLWPFVEIFLRSLNGKRVKQELGKESYVLRLEESSELQFTYQRKEKTILAVLEEIGGIGGSNVFAHLDDILIWLSGRLVWVEIEDNRQMKFSVDPTEKVFGVQYVGSGNSCEVPVGTEINVCRFRQRECCIFLSLGVDGFRCEKFSGPTARLLLDRLGKGETNATRVGSCALIGRKKD